MQESAKATDWYISQFHTRELLLNGEKDSAIHRFRRNALSVFEHLPFPDRKDENWKYTNLNSFLKKQFNEVEARVKIEPAPDHSFSDIDRYQIRFVDGILDTVHSDLDALRSEADIMTIEDALQDAGLSELAETHLNGIIEEKTSAFTVMNLAFAKQGILLRLRKNTRLSKPVMMHYVSTGADSDMVSQLCIIAAEEGAEGKLIEIRDSAGASGEHFQNLYHRFDLAPNAHLDYYVWQNGDLNSTQVHSTDVWQDRESTFTSLRLDIGGKLVRNNLYVYHRDSGITTNLYGVYLPTGKQHIDNQTFIDHAFPHCQSNELYKGIMEGRSKAVFNGKVIVRQDAQKTNAFQQNNNLILSDLASVDTKPQLEIFADDVRCSHGATIGQLDANAIYYLMTRGLSKSQAQELLKVAFLQDVFTRLEDDPVAVQLQQSLTDYLDKQQS